VKRETPQPSRAELRRVTPGESGPVVRRIPKRTLKPEPDAEKLERIAGEALDRHLEDEDTFHVPASEAGDPRAEEPPQNRTV